MNQEEIIHEWYVSLGARTSERKQASSRANAMLAGAANRRPSSCTCGRVDVMDPLEHKAACRIYQAEKARIRRAKQKEEEATS